MAARMQIRQGYMKFIRLGPVKFTEQSRWGGRAPESKGLWAFPYPYYDEFFTFHKYTDLLPKKYREDSLPELPEDFTDEQYTEGLNKLLKERDEWIRTVGRRILKLREFWYRGDVYTHFLPNGEIGNSIAWAGEMDWNLMDVSKLHKSIKSSGGDRCFYEYKGHLIRSYSTVDHLEVFIPEGRGTIRHRLTRDK